MAAEAEARAAADAPEDLAVVADGETLLADVRAVCGGANGEIAPLGSAPANPYRIPDRSPWFHVVNVSGGRSSAYMLKQVLDAHGGALPDRCEAVFANTGRERSETLDFVAALSDRWHVPITWLEFDHDPEGRGGTKYVARFVDRGTASGKHGGGAVRCHAAGWLAAKRHPSNLHG